MGQNKTTQDLSHQEKSLNNISSNLNSILKTPGKILKPQTEIKHPSDFLYPSILNTSTPPLPTQSISMLCESKMDCELLCIPIYSCFYSIRNVQYAYPTCFGNRVLVPMKHNTSTSCKSSDFAFNYFIISENQHTIRNKATEYKVLH